MNFTNFNIESIKPDYKFLSWSYFSGRYEKIVYTDSETGFSFPESIGNFKYCKIIEYEDPKFGYSLFYRDENSVLATIYIYDLDFSMIQDGTDHFPTIFTFEQAINDLESAEPLGLYKTISHSLGDSNISPLFLQTSFDIVSNDGQELKSYIFLRGQRNKFIKVRVTASKLNDLSNNIRNFIESLYISITKNIITLNNSLLGDTL
jgi:hypothetical protein